MMLRFINSNRAAAIGLAVAVVVVAVTMFGRFGTRAEPNDASTSATNQYEQPVVAVVPDDALPEAGAASASTGSETDSEWLAVPVDPTGARRDRSEAGAQQSAIDFASTVQQRLLYLSNDAATELLRTWSAESIGVTDVEDDIEELATLRSTLTSGGGNVWWSVTPIASRIDAHDDQRARVAIWVVQVVGSDVDPQRGGNAVAPTVDFRTTTIDLVWTDVGWSVWATSSTPGPVPMMSPASTMSAPIEFMDVLGDFTLTKEHS